MVAVVDELLVTVSCPVAEPVVAGSKIRLTFKLCPGLRVAGRLTGDTEKPLPVTATEFTVTVTDATFAVKAALVAVAGTVTEAGRDAALLLLVRLTQTPPVGADPDKLTVHVSASEPVIDVLLQTTLLTTGDTVVPVPLRLTAAVEALLEIVNCPFDELAVVGSN
jgi:hypothetical protein